MLWVWWAVCLSISPCLGLKLAEKYSWSILPTKQPLRALDVPGGPVPAALVTWSAGYLSSLSEANVSGDPFSEQPWSFLWCQLRWSLTYWTPTTKKCCGEDKRKSTDMAQAPENLTTFLEIQWHQGRKKSTHISKSSWAKTHNIGSARMSPPNSQGNMVSVQDGEGDMKGKQNEWGEERLHSGRPWKSEIDLNSVH